MIRFSLAGLALAVVCLSAGCAPSEMAADSQSDAVSLDTDESRTLYALGTLLADNLSQFSLTAEEGAFVAAGLEDAVAGADLQVDLDVYGPMVGELANTRAEAQAAAAAAAAEGFLAEMAAQPGAEVTESGLIFIPEVVGDGDSPGPTDSVNVHYHGTLADGSVFDSSVERGETISFPLNRVIPCWTEGLQKMAVGGKAVLVCPSDIAYGDRGSPPAIPGGAALKFEVELFAVE